MRSLELCPHPLILTPSITHQGLEVHGDLSYNWCRPSSSYDIPRIQKCNYRMLPSGLLKCRKDLAPKSRSSREKTTLTRQTGWWCHTQYADRWRTLITRSGRIKSSTMASAQFLPLLFCLSRGISSTFRVWSTYPSRSAPVPGFLLLQTVSNLCGVCCRYSSKLRIVSPYHRLVEG